MDRYNIYFDDELTYSGVPFDTVIDVLNKYNNDRKKPDTELKEYLGKIKIVLI